jgi:hypothetical protein
MVKSKEKIKGEVNNWIKNGLEKSGPFSKIKIEEAKENVEYFLNKYYNASKKYLEDQKTLTIDFNKKFFGVYISIALAVIGFTMAFIYIEILKSWNEIANFLIYMYSAIHEIGMLDVLAAHIIVFIIVIICCPILFYRLLRNRIFPLLRNIIVKRQNIGEIELYVIEKIIEEKTQDEPGSSSEKEEIEEDKVIP